MKPLKRIRAVLVEPQFPRNIGSAARALKTMGLDQLWLVRPAEYPHKEATMMAAEAVDVLQAARVVETLDEALADCVLTVATSTRERSLDWPALDVDETVTKVLTATVDGEVALVFGPEPGGLTSEDLYRCQYRSFLPTSSDCRSLNLAQAVQVYGYALRRGLESDSAETEPRHRATAGELDHFYQHLMEVMEALEFPRRDPEHLALRIRALFNRTELSSSDVNLLRGILGRVEQRLGQTKGETED